MVRMVTLLLVWFIGFNVLGLLSEGEQGLVSSVLTSDVTATDTIITVTSTEGFLESNDYILIEEEFICYASTSATQFTGLTRACKNTEATSHLANTTVFNETTGVINSLTGFNISQTDSVWDVITLPFQLGLSIVFGFVKITTFDYPFFAGVLWGFPLVYLKMFFWAVAGGFVTFVIFSFINRGG